jgi:cell division protein FtsB
MNLPAGSRRSADLAVKGKAVRAVIEGMKRFSVVASLSAATAIYCLVSLSLGPRGFWAMRQLESQREAVGAILESLSLIRDDLDSRLKNLSADRDTISVYAHELGYVAEGERLISSPASQAASTVRWRRGMAIRVTKPEHLPEWVCKLIALSAARRPTPPSRLQKQGGRMRIRKDDPRSADLAVAVLRSSSVAVTAYGHYLRLFGHRSASHARIVELKGRGRGQGVHRVVSSVDEAERITGPIPAAFRSYWPGPLTLILRTGAGTTAYRCPRGSLAARDYRKGRRPDLLDEREPSGRDPAVQSSPRSRKAFGRQSTL